jgi:glycosyltransferase involved in cell wall biosynthesis
MTVTPFVSIVTATRNRLSLLRAALDSIAAQEYEDYEVIVVDDGSDPATQDEYGSVFSGLSSRFILHRATPAGSLGRGPSASRNLGIRSARGEYVAFLDDDDRWVRTDHLKVAVDALKTTGADFFFANMLSARDGEIQSENWFPGLPELTRGEALSREPGTYVLSDATIRLLARRQGAHPDGWVVRRSILLEVNGFWEPPAEDYELFIHILDRAQGVVYRATPTVEYRLPAADSVSSRFSPLEEDLHIVMNALHIRATCRNPWVLRSARAREAWHLRRLALLMLAQGRAPAARSFAIHALCTYPTPGAIALAVRTMFQFGAAR